MAARRTQSNSSMHTITYAAIAISIISLVLSLYTITHPSTITTKIVYQNKTVYTSLKGFNITGSLIMPQSSLPNDPPITANGTVGKRLTGLNSPLNASELSVINNASMAYFEKAGQMYLNGSITNEVSATPLSVPPFLVNGKPSVIYFGSITCIFCGENRWAMALALGRFGNFSALYQGYSSLGDGDLPTLYWSPAQYNQSSIDLGDFYSSKYINFIAMEDTDPITQGFDLQTFSTIQQEVNATGNIPYEDAFKYILQINNFQGTPYTIWGGSQVGGADAVDLGNSTATINGTYGLGLMTHAQVLKELSNPHDSFGWTEYAAADLYIAMTCSAINESAPVCTLPAILQIQKQNGY